jgi:hypothetical protein
MISIQSLMEVANSLHKASRPRNGFTIPVGSRDTERQAKADSIYVFVFALERGLTPKEACELAISNSRIWIAKWNTKREAYVHIDEDRYVSYFRYLEEQFSHKVPIDR